jgi:hypothetical protein
MIISPDTNDGKYRALINEDEPYWIDYFKIFGKFGKRENE